MIRQLTIQLITLILSTVALYAQNYPQIVTFETSDAESATFTSVAVQKTVPRGYDTIYSATDSLLKKRMCVCRHRHVCRISEC